jgi:hypothetical protein
MDMNLFCGAGLVIATIVLGAPVQARRDLVDLRQIGHVASKGRVQDQQLPVVEALIKASPAAVPFLVSKIEDRTPLPGRGAILDFWPRVEAGHIAFLILCDLFTPPEDGPPTVRGLDWDHVLERSGEDLPSWALYAQFVAKHGRAGVRVKVERLLAPYKERLVWATAERCFRLRT